MTVTPMFPLGIVHFPHVVLPLQVFEPRYRQLTIDCLGGDREFGVVLISRGSEVGGGDERVGVGTMTTIVDAGFDQRGLIRLTTVGSRRIRVVRWLEDDPYPRAEIEELAGPEPPDAGAMAGVERKVRRALAMQAELGDPAVPFTIALDDDPGRAVYQLAAIAPLGPLDQQRLLEAEPAGLLPLLDNLVDEQMTVLASRLGGH